MGFLFSGIFWGIILILLGASVIINLIFHVHVPLFRIIFALVLIYLGLRVMVGGHGEWRCWGSRGVRDSSAIFCDGAVFDKSSDGEYSIIFGRGVVEAGAIFAADSARMRIRVNTVFGNTVIRVPKNIPVAVRATAAFGEVKMPHGSASAFGKTIYKNDAGRLATDASVIRKVDVNVVFGACRIEER